MRQIVMSSFLLCILITIGSNNVAQAQLPVSNRVDRPTAASGDIRELRGKHIRLFTDLPTSPAVDELPAVFDAAVPIWADYFGVDLAQTARWRVEGHLVEDREKFAERGLLPADNFQFLNGFAHERELWVQEQASDYYRRHLLLHEGTHAFMLNFLGGGGPGWHTEGIAELLGTHRWEAGKLTLGVMPTRREDVPMWGRIKLIRQAVAAGKPLSIEEVLRFDSRRRLTTDQYAWSWALVSLLENSDSFRRPLHDLQNVVADPRYASSQDAGARFNRHFRDSLGGENWRRLELEWQAMIAELDYGYDHRRMAIVPRKIEQLADGAAKLKIAADRGWQSSGWLLSAGQNYRIEATGRFRVALDEPTTPPTPWPCEPGGVTLEYHEGQPLGKLLGALVPKASGNAKLTKDAVFSHPVAIGLNGVLQPKFDSVLYLRVNDHPAHLGDNRGWIKVSISPMLGGKKQN